MENIKPQRVMDEEWKFLFIIDSCRYDYFELLNRIKGKLEMRYSPASSTDYWLRSQFTDYYNDIIYVSGNLFVGMDDYSSIGFNGSRHFKKVIEVWRYGDIIDYTFVHPRGVNKSFRKAYIRNPKYRFIVHYMQPDTPYLWNSPVPFPDNVTGLSDSKIESDGISHEQVVAGYIINLMNVLKYVKRLVDFLRGKGRIIVTADHGKLLGEYGEYNHPPHLEVPELRIVPWLIIDK